MGQEIVYCSQCGARLVTSDFDKGSAVRHENRIACAACAPELLRNLGPAERRALPDQPRSPLPASRRGPPSSTRLNPVPARPKLPSRTGWVVGGAAAGALVLVVLLVLLDGRGPAPGPAAAPIARREAPPRLPEVGPAPPARAQPQKTGEDAKAVERAMAEAMEKEKGERFARYLEEIRGKIEADPNLLQRGEIERMLEAADRQAGGRAAEVARLRADYARRLEQASRAPSLVGHWTLDEGAGLLAKDASGRGHDGKLVSASPKWVEGRFGTALAFDDMEEHVLLPSSPVLTAVQEGSYTLAAWFKPAELPADGRRFAILIKPGHHLGLSYSSAQQFHMDHWIDKGNAGVRTAAVFPPGRFYAVVGVVDREQGKTRLYVDGTLEATRPWAAGSAAHAFGTSAWRIGLAATSNPQFRWGAKGVIDDVRIYARALADKEVAELARPASR